MAKNLLRTVLKEYKRTPGLVNTREIIDRIESGYIADTRNGFKTKKTFSPSTIVYGHGACARYWYLAFDGADFQEEFTPWQVANMRSGTLSHERIQKAIQDSGIMIETETKILHNDPPILGYRDGLIEWNGAAIPIEIKTCNDRSFEARKASGKALSYHIEQLLIYMRIKDHDLGLIIYENKNTHELYVVPVEMSDEYKLWLDNTFDWLRKVKQAHVNRTMPANMYRSNSKVCKSCPLLETCKTSPPGTVAIKPLEPLE